MITENYVSLQIAKLLKEKGFNEPCDYRYYETHSGFELGLDPGYTNSHWEDWYKNMGVRNYSAPTLQMTLKWLREVHHYYVQIMLDGWAYDNHSGYYITILGTDSDLEIISPNVDENDTIFFPTYEQACEEAIKYILKNLV